MANSFLNWLERKKPAQPTAPAPKAPSKPGASIFHDITHNPVTNFVGHDVVHPIVHAPETFERDVATPIDDFADKSAVGRGLQTVGLGGYRAIVGLGQAASGLTNLAARHHVLEALPGVGPVLGHFLEKPIEAATNKTDKVLTNQAKLTDTTAKQNHANSLLYHGTQVVANLLPAFLTGGESEVAEGAGEEAGEQASKSALSRATSKLTDKLPDNAPGRIAGRYIKSATSPKLLAENAAYQGYTAGQQHAEGKKVNPVSNLESLGVYQAGLPLVGAAAREGLDSIKPVIMKTAKGVISRFSDTALKGAEKESGLSRDLVANDHDANVLADEANRQEGGKANNGAQTKKEASTIAKQFNIDLDSGSPTEKASRINAYLDQRNDFVTAHNLIGEGGYARVPGSNTPAPDELEQPKPSPEASQPSQQSKAPEQSTAPSHDQTPADQQPQAKQHKQDTSLPDDTTNTEPVKSEAEQYAEAFGVTRMQAEKDLAQMGAQEAERKTLTPQELRALSPDEKLNVKQRREIINTNPAHATSNTVELNPISDTSNKTYSIKAKARSAIAQASGIDATAQSKLDRAVKLGKKLSKNDKQLLYKYDAGGDIEDLAKTADKPKQFRKAALAYADATDYDLAARRAGGEATLKQKNYVPHNYAVSEEWLEEHKIPENQWIKQGKQVKGFRDTTAKYSSYEEAAAKTKGALKPLYDSPVKDLEEYAEKGGISRRNNLLTTALAKATPGEIGSRNEEVSSALFGSKQLHPAAHGRLPFNATDDLDKHLDAYKSIAPRSIAGKVANKAVDLSNQATKRVLFLGTPYHYVNEQASFIGKNLLHPINLARGEKRFIQTVATRGDYQRLLEAADAEKLPNGESALTAIRKMGVVLPDDSTLNRASSAFSLTEAQAALRRGLDPNSKEAVDLGQQINHLMGHRNLLVEGSHPLVHKIASFGSLAPSWSTTQLGLVKDALTKGFNPAGNFARSAVIGKRVALAGTAIGTTIAIKHRLPTKEEALNEAGLTPENPVPNIELNSKNKGNGESQEMVTPTDPLGLATGLLTERSHFVQSRLSPLLSFAEAVHSGQNFNEQPLTTATPGTPEYYKQLILNAAKNSLEPIGVQVLTNPTNSKSNPSIVQGIEEDFGGRLKTNPNDPNYKATQQYFKAMDGAYKGQPAAVTSVLNQYQSRTVNAQGQKLKPGTVGDYLNAKLLTVNQPANQKALSQLYNAQHSLANNDPLWKLPLNAPAGKPSVTAYLKIQAQYEGEEKDGAVTAAQGSVDSGWYTTLNNARTAYYAKLPASSDAAAAEPAYPTFKGQQNADVIMAGKISGTDAYDDFLDSHPDVVDANIQLAKWTNQIRALEGAPPQPLAPTATPEVQKAIATYDALAPTKSEGNTNKATMYERDDWIKANQALYDQMSSYFAQDEGVSLIKNAVAAEYSGQNLSSQSLLKDTKEVGEDVATTTNPDGTTSYSLNPEAAYDESSGSGGSGYDYADEYNYINPAYQALHDLVYSKKPSVVKLRKQSGLAKPVKAYYRAPATKKPTIRTSTIALGAPKIGTKQKAVV